MKRIGIYARVSTDGQTVENQLRELRQVGKRRGWQVISEFTDNGVSGRNGRDKRPGFDDLCKAATQRKIDVVMAWSVDRLGRSLRHLVTLLEDLHSAGCDLYLHQQGIDTTTPSGKAMFQMCGVFAEFERSMLVERTKAGLARARAQGKTLGRPRVSTAIERKVLKARGKGLGIKRIARQLGVGTGTVQRIVRAG